MPADPIPKPAVGQIIWPTKQQMEKGLEAIERFEPLWKASPALLVIKPHLGAIVSLENVVHDEHYFALIIAVKETIVVPEGFDPQERITLRCVWNQPYLSLSADSVSAPYSFYLQFGEEGVQHVRELRAMRLFDKLRDSPILLGLLKSCFLPNFKLPPESSKGETG